MYAQIANSELPFTLALSKAIVEQSKRGIRQWRRP